MYYATNNNQLTSLDGAPLKVKYVFGCQFNKLTTIDLKNKLECLGFYCWGNTNKLDQPDNLICNRFEP
jgi:hypothetical protein